MPRGPVVYTLPPGTTPQNPGDVIQSAVWNAAMDDFAQTLNTVQPVEYGGTNASSAVGGIDNLSTQGNDLPSANTMNISSATGQYIHITGNTSISSFTSSTAGVTRKLVFDGSLILVHNSANFILPGGVNIQTSAGDTAEVVCEGGTAWRFIRYDRALAPQVSGSWTPSTRQPGAVSTSLNSGRYLRTGTYVTAWMTATFSAIGNAGNPITITGLPFTPSVAISTQVIGSGYFFDSGNQFYSLSAFWNGSEIRLYAGGLAADFGLATTIAVGDRISIVLNYEV